MQIVNRRTLYRIGAMILALMLIFSSVASYAATASFAKKGAGVKYNSKTFKLDDSYKTKDLEKALKKAFGKSYTRNTDDGCTFGYATYEYIFKSKGVRVETLQKKKGGKEQIITIELTKKTVPTIAGLKVGDATSKIKKLYGKKGQQNKTGTQFEYTTGDYILNITAKKSKITKITIMKDL